VADKFERLLIRKPRQIFEHKFCALKTVAQDSPQRSQTA